MKGLLSLAGVGVMEQMLTQVPLPLLSGDAVEIALDVGMVTGPDGTAGCGVHGLVTLAGDEPGGG